MGAAGNGTTIPTTFYSGLDDRTKKFETDFIANAKAAGIDRTAAAQFDAATYDIVLIYAQAMKAANVTGDPAKLAAECAAFRDEIRKMKDFPALEGPISFGSNGDALKPAYIIEMQDGKWNLRAHYPANG
jgi:branched-chain amino acid transport system substrate-binding protein